MSTAYTRRLGTACHLTANNKLWTVERSGGKKMLAELNRGKDGGLSFFPGMWSGQPRQGFGALEGAGEWRRRAMDPRKKEHARLFKVRAREAIEFSAQMRRAHELLLERREMIKESEHALRSAVGIRRAA